MPLDRPRRSALAALGLALLLHAAGWWLLRSPPGSRPQAERVPRHAPLTVRLLWSRPEPAAAPPAAAPLRAAPRHPSPMATRSAPQAITASPITASPIIEPQPQQAAAEAGPVPQPAQRPLLLTLPPPSAASAPRPARESALNDPRANTGHRTYSERFAATLGTDLTEHVTPINGGRRIRRGTSCIEVMESRASQIDPYGPKWPGGVRSCD